MTERRALLLSLRPRFADAILDGTKRIELRRIRPRALPGTPILIYASSPTMALVGGCTVASLAVGEPDDVWQLHGHLTSVNRAEYDSYFEGVQQAVAIQVAEPWRLRTPVPLENLRSGLDGFHPPQSYRYIQLSALRGLLPASRLKLLVS